MFKFISIFLISLVKGKLLELAKGPRGQEYPITRCPDGQALAGVQTRGFEYHFGKDNIGLSGVRFICANVMGDSWEEGQTEI